MDDMLDNLLIYFPIFYQRLTTSKEINQKQKLLAYYQILGTLKHKGKLPISVLGEWLYISRPNMTFHVDKLVADGMVERYPDPHDRRVTKIGLTKIGETFIDDARSLVEENMKNNLVLLSKKELEELYESVETVKKILLKINPRDNNESL